MKKTGLILLFIGVASLLFADDLVTKSGKTYKDYALMGATPTGIRVMHSTGVSTVLVNDFPDDLSPEMKALVKKFEKEIPEAKKKAEERKKKREALRKKQQAAAKAEAALVKKSAEQLKKEEKARQDLATKIKSKSGTRKENPFGKK